MLMTPVVIQAQNLDIRILRAVHSNHPVSSDGFWQFISDSDKPVAIGAPVGMGIAALLTHDKTLTENTVELCASTVVNLGTTYALKYSIDRPRPYETYPDILPKSVEGSASFPSGHTSAAFNAATVLSLMYPEWYVAVPSYVWAGAVGYSRMHLGVHYPSDVAAGAALGIGSAWLTHTLNKWYKKKHPRLHGRYE